MVSPRVCFLTVFTKRQYGSIHIVFFESFDQKIIWFNPYCLLTKYWAQDNMVQPILSFSKVLTKRQYGSTRILFFESFDQKALWFYQDCVFGKFWPKDYVLLPKLSFLEIFPKRQCGLTHIVFFESFDQKTICFNLHCHFWSRDQNTKSFNPSFLKSWLKHNMVQPILSFLKVLNERQYGSTHTAL